MARALPRYIECPTLQLDRIELTRAVRKNRIMVAAYYKAQSRGFDPGHDLDDWLEAEREVAALYRAPH